MQPNQFNSSIDRRRSSMSEKNQHTIVLVIKDGLQLAKQTNSMLILCDGAETNQYYTVIDGRGSSNSLINQKIIGATDLGWVHTTTNEIGLLITGRLITGRLIFSWTN